jgi:hypothetical protein
MRWRTSEDAGERQFAQLKPGIDSSILSLGTTVLNTNSPPGSACKDWDAIDSLAAPPTDYA